MTGAEDLFSDPQPVTETWSALSLSGGVAGISPQKGSAEPLAWPQGKAFPFIRLSPFSSPPWKLSENYVYF